MRKDRNKGGVRVDIVFGRPLQGLGVRGRRLPRASARGYFRVAIAWRFFAARAGVAPWGVR